MRHDRVGSRAGTAELREPGLGDLAPAILFLVIGIPALVLGSLMTSTVPGQYLVITGPGADRGELLDLVHRSNGGVVAFGGLPGIAIAASEDPGFTETVRAEGAWLAIPSPRLIGCIIETDGEPD